MYIKTMKILIATDFYLNNLGGVTTSLLALCSGLRRQGHDVRILTLSGNGQSYRDGDTYFIGSFPAYYAPDMRMSVRFNDPLLKELMQWRPEIIHAQSEGSAFSFSRKIQKTCNIPLIISCHTDYAYFVFGDLRNVPLIQRFSTAVSRFVYRHAYRIIVPSRKSFTFSFLQPFKDRMIVLPNGIESRKHQNSLSESERRKMRKELGIRDEDKLLVAITRISREKNLQELITFLPSLLERVPEAILLIVGKGPYKKKLERLIVKYRLQDHVIFTGPYPAEEIWRCYALGDVFVSASLFEVHSMSCLEALANGLPLLCRKDLSLDGVLEDGSNGFMYETEEEFTDRASLLLNDDQLRNKMGETSKQKAFDFSSDHFASAALKIYEDVIRDWNTENGI